MKNLVYLVGPITGTSYHDCTNWREEFAKEFEGLNIHCLDPMRGKLYLAGNTSIADRYDEHILSTGKAIFVRDRFDCFRADLIVANFLGATRVSIGSVMELAWANSKDTPIIAVMESGNVHDHAMLRETCGWIVQDLDQAAGIVKAILSESSPIL